MPPRHSRGLKITLLAFALLCCCGFAALGVWQVKRLFWKLDLIERVESRVKALAVAPPGPALWPSVNAARDEYLRVRVTGRFLPGKSSLAQATTELGAGFWQLAPLRTAGGEIHYINRGFLRADQKALFAQFALLPEDEVTLTGLLRLSEPGGGFLRRNDPSNQRWFSRDVAAMAAAQGLPVAQVAPYFIDEAAAPVAGDAPARPVAGLTVIHFRNTHLVYALTWFALALMTAAAIVYGWRSERRPPPTVA